MKKKHKENLVKLLKTIVFFVLSEIILVCLFFSVTVNNSQLNENNTIKNVVKINEVYVQKNPNRSDKLYFLINTEEYYLVWHDFNKGYTNILQDLKFEDSVVITVRNSSNIFSWEQRKEIVDIRTEEDIYYDIRYSNIYREENLTAGIIAVVAVWFFCTASFISRIWWLCAK